MSILVEVLTFVAGGGAAGAWHALNRWRRAGGSATKACPDPSRRGDVTQLTMALAAKGYVVETSGTAITVKAHSKTVVQFQYDETDFGTALALVGDLPDAASWVAASTLPTAITTSAEQSMSAMAALCVARGYSVEYFGTLMRVKAGPSNEFDTVVELSFSDTDFATAANFAKGLPNAREWLRAREATEKKATGS